MLMVMVLVGMVVVTDWQIQSLLYARPADSWHALIKGPTDKPTE